ncbi:MAG TPA: pyrroline-5-carboxylate reductase [Burkholderiales bacterium]|nr:pyrroline-5-carboxylate reductase [Burkholderiales bacterium]
MNVSFVGGGNMANALIGGLLQQGAAASSLRVIDVSSDARNAVQRRFGVAVFADLRQGCAGSDIIILAVKPQQLRDVALELKALLQSQIVISIAAGIRTRDLSRWLGGYSRIVRVMPNTPALVGAGISGLYAMPKVALAERQQAEAILSAVGSTLWLEHEDQLDAITAVSGSGPAYVFYFIEALQRAAQELGLDAQRAKQLSLDTFAGAVKLAKQGTEDAQILRQRVTSKGGTTERAISAMEQAQLQRHIINAVRAAQERSRELGDEFGKAE